MTEAESYSLVIEYIAVAHSLGEGVWARIDLWIGASSALIVLGYLAPERLTWGLTALIIFLYVALSAFFAISVIGDLRTADGIIKDAGSLVEMYNLQSHGLSARAIDAEGSFLGTMSYFVFAGGLFCGTIGFLIYSCYKKQGSN